MTTVRYYLEPTAPPVSPPLGAGWDFTQGFSYLLSPTRLNTGSANRTGAAQTGLTSTGLGARYTAADPLPAGVYSGIMSAAVYATVGSSTFKGHARWVARIVSPAGVERGILADVHSGGYATAGTTHQRAVSSVVLTPVTALAGDLLVVEVGCYGVNTSATTARAMSHHPGSTSGAVDLIGNDGDPGGASMADWVEFTWHDPEPPEPPPPPHDRRFWTQRLAVRLGLDPVGVQPVVEAHTLTAPDGGWAVDPDLSAALIGYTITYGRADATTDTESIEATLDLATDLLPGPVEIGTHVRLALCAAVADELGLTDAERIRFTGITADPTVRHATRTTQVRAAGALGRGYRLPVDPTGWPVESDGARVARTLAAAGLAARVGTLDHSTWPLAAPTAPAPAARMIETTSRSTLGQLVEDPTGRLDWHGIDRRRGTTPTLTLEAGEVLHDISWSQRTADLVTTVDVATPTATLTVTDPAAADPVTGYGPYPAALETVLTTPADAYALGTLIVGRRGRPAWRLPDLTVDLIRTATPATLPELLRLRHGDRLQLAGLPAGCPVPAVVFCEGWTETATPRTWRLTVPVSDPIASGVSVRWIDVPATTSYQWTDLRPSLSWLDVARIENPTQLLP